MEFIVIYIKQVNTQLPNPWGPPPNLLDNTCDIFDSIFFAILDYLFIGVFILIENNLSYVNIVKNYKRFHICSILPSF